MRVSLDGSSFVRLATGTAGAGLSSVAVNPWEFYGDGAGVPLSLRPSSVTLQGNIFNAANSLLMLDASGHYPALNGSMIANLAAANVSAGALGPGVIASSIAASSVGTLQLADGAVTGSKLAGGIGQDKVSGLPADLGAKVSRAGDSMSGDLRLGGSTYSASGFLTDRKSVV